MKCSEIRELLSLYIDDMLEQSLREEVSAHIDACPECRREYEELVSITKMLAELPEVRVPADFDGRLRDALNAEKAGEKAESGYETVRVSKKKLIRRISSICAIFVVGIFALTMYNNIDRLIPGDDADKMMLSSQYNYADDAAEENNKAKKSDETYADYGTAKSTDADIAGVNDDLQTGSNGTAADMSAPDAAKAADMSRITGGDFAGYGDSTADAALPLTEDAPEAADVDTAPTAPLAASASPESENPVSRGSETFPPLAMYFKDGTVTNGAISDARDSVAIRYYMRALEKMLGNAQFEILMCESKGDGLWSFDIELVSTDEEGKETHEYVTYYGQDGTLWKETEAEE